MAGKIDATADVAAKQALAERIQAIAAKYWTDGEILAIANSLLLRLGLVPQEGSTASARKKGSAVIFHVPRPSVPEAAGANISPVLPNAVAPSSVSPVSVPAAVVPPSPVLPSIVPTDEVPPSKAPPVKASAAPLEPQSPVPPVVTIPAAEPSSKITPASSKPKQASRSNSTALIIVSVAATILVAAILFFARKHPAPSAATTTAAAPTVSAPIASAPAVSPPTAAAPVATAPSQTIPEPSPPASLPPSDSAAGKVTPADQPFAAPTLGTLLVVAGQDNASVFLNGKLQRQLTQGGQLRLPNLELKDYDVQVSKSGFQDPPQQKIRIRSGEQALVFSLQPQPSLASLTIQGATPGTTVLVDQTPVGTIQPDGALSVATVTPGDHTVELRKERFKPRQFKKHFVVGGTISLSAADAALEPAPGDLKITFAPADAKVGIVNGDRLTIVSSGVPLNLAPGTYTLTARTADGFTRSSTFEVVAGQSKTLDLSLVPNGMSKWDDPGAWRHDGDSYVRKGGDFVLYGVVPASGTFVFSAMPAKGRLLQWVINYTDPKNYVLFQMDDNNFYRTVIRNGQKTDQIIVPDKGDKKSFRALHIRVSPNEIVHQIKHGYSWTVLDRWTQPGADLSLGKFGFYIPGNDEVALSSFAQYVDLNTR